jgi:NADH-quinone oxidoreductase subunit J
MIEIVFYTFATLLIAGSLLVVFAKNPVKSVLSLVFCFLNAAALLLLTGAEFVSIILIVVYIGAVVVLFLFVVMTLSTEELSYRKVFKMHYLPFLVGIITAVQLTIISFNEEYFPSPQEEFGYIPNTEEIAYTLYTNSFLQFQLGGLILLVALIGAILLSDMTSFASVKRQSVWKQMATDPKDRIKLIKKNDAT